MAPPPIGPAQPMFDRMHAARQAGRFDEALAIARLALQTFPQDPVAHYYVGLLQMQYGRLDEGERDLRRAQTMDPANQAIRYALATTLLAEGRYAEGWPLYQARFDVPEFHIRLPAGFPFPQWRGQKLKRGARIVVFPEQGFGDQIQFARFVPVLRRRGIDVVLLTRPALTRLVADSFPDSMVLSAEGSVDFPDPDFWAMSSDLAWMAGATVRNIDGGTYLAATLPPPALPDGLRIGVMLKGNPLFVYDAYRSLPAEQASAVREGLPGSLVDLDPEVTGAADFAETAAIIAALDAVVSVDTSVAHLAGALGKPCFMLLPAYATDWRWMRGRSDTPWYAKTRLHRAALGAGWAGAVEALLADVRTRLA